MYHIDKHGRCSKVEEDEGLDVDEIEYKEIEELKGKVLRSIDQVNDTALFFTTVESDEYIMKHFQECCESVTIEDIDGDLGDLIGEPILMAEEVSSDINNTALLSDRWTFYKLGTCKGSVTIRWHGESNGYYSVKVDFYKSI